MKEKEILKDKDLEMFGGKLSQEKTQMSYFFFSNQCHLVNKQCQLGDDGFFYNLELKKLNFYDLKDQDRTMELQ